METKPNVRIFFALLKAHGLYGKYMRYAYKAHINKKNIADLLEGHDDFLWESNTACGYHWWNETSPIERRRWMYLYLSFIELFKKPSSHWINRHAHVQALYYSVENVSEFQDYKLKIINKIMGVTGKFVRVI